MASVLKTSKRTVLLVEDSKLQRLTGERTLSKEGYSVLSAATGEEALRLARERVPDLVLLDMLLPGMGGECVLRALKKRSCNQRNSRVGAEWPRGSELGKT